MRNFKQRCTKWAIFKPVILIFHQKKANTLTSLWSRHQLQLIKLHKIMSRSYAKSNLSTKCPPNPCDTCKSTQSPTGEVEQAGSSPFPSNVLAGRSNQQEHICMTELGKRVCVALDKLFTSL